MKLQRYELAGTYDDDVRPRDDGRWCESDDVAKLEESCVQMVGILKDARHVCAYPDRDTDLLDEIDALLNKLGETELPELQ